MKQVIPNKIDSLIQLKELLDSKTINEDEYNSLKREILGGGKSLDNYTNSNEPKRAENKKLKYISLTKTVINSCLILGFVFLFFGAMQKMLHIPIANISLRSSMYFLLFVFSLLSISMIYFKIFHSEFSVKFFYVLTILLLPLSFFYFSLPLISESHNSLTSIGEIFKIINSNIFEKKDNSINGFDKIKKVSSLNQEENSISNSKEYFHGYQLKEGERIIKIDWGMERTRSFNNGDYYVSDEYFVPQGKKWILLCSRQDSESDKFLGHVKSSTTAIIGFRGNLTAEKYYYLENIDVGKAKDNNYKFYSGEKIIGKSLYETPSIYSGNIIEFHGELIFLETVE